jgi:hypothetical protein
MLRIRSLCCACPVSGHAATPLSTVMNSRRLMRSSQAEGHTGCRFLSQVRGVVRYSNFARRCPLWVKSRLRALLGLCPLYPRKRTSDLRVTRSAPSQAADELF